jgi:putative ABC transport system ATP-binding protein
MDLLKELNAEGLTLVLVTHDATIGAMAERLIVMRDGMIESTTARTD